MNDSEKENKLQEEMYYKTIDHEKINSIGQQILDKIKEANGKPEDYTIVPISTEFMTITQKLSWVINAEWSAKEFVGNCSENTYGADSISDVKNLSDQKIQTILNSSGPKSLNQFIDKLSAPPKPDTAKEIPLDCGCYYSHVYPCRDRRCRYGKIQCPTCNGRGQVPFYTQNKQDWMNCQTCYGGRNIRCPSCSGHSVMTYLSTVEAFANPKIETSFPDQHQETSIYKAIKQIDLDKLKHFVSMEHSSSHKYNNGTPYFIYKGVFEFHSFKIIGPNQEEYYFSKFQKLPIFFESDPILDSILEPLISKYEGKKEQDILAEFSKNTILNNALQSYSSPFNGSKSLGENIQTQSRDLVSSEVAEKIGAIGEKSLNKLSPKFTWKLWAFLNVIGFGFLITPSAFLDHRYTEEIFAYIAITSILITLISYLATKYKQKNVESSLRRKIHKFIPAILSFLLLSGALIFAEYQIVTQKRQAYTLKPMSSEQVKKQFENMNFYLTKNTNIRKGPSTKSQIITTLPKGTILKDVLPYNSQWYQINFNNKRAYVYHSLVKIK